ncbi:hypothetical protein JCM8097_008557 [Rhodosporidiobolus ruineniae]
MLLQRLPLLLLAPILAVAAPTGNSTAASGTPSSATGGATARATSLLSVPTYAQATATQSAFSTATASALAASLPGYVYNLTMANEATRISICNQTTANCAAAGCSSSEANVTTNFCNPTTMGWNCDCNKGADSRLQALVVPVNTYDCRLRTSACLDQCSNPSALPEVNSTTACKNACNYILGSTCGTSNQVLPEYQVKKYDDTPKYYADTSKGGVAMGITTSSAPLSLTFPLLAALIAAAGGATLVLG